MPSVADGERECGATAGDHVPRVRGDGVEEAVARRVEACEQVDLDVDCLDATACDERGAGHDARGGSRDRARGLVERHGHGRDELLRDVAEVRERHVQVLAVDRARARCAGGEQLAVPLERGRRLGLDGQHGEQLEQHAAA